METLNSLVNAYTSQLGKGKIQKAYKGILTFLSGLGGSNRKVQADYIDLLSRRDIGSYRLSKPAPGVDAIIKTVLVRQPDFDRPDALREQIERSLMVFIRDVSAMLSI